MPLRATAVPHAFFRRQRGRHGSGRAEDAAGAPEAPGVPDAPGEEIHHEDGPNLPENSRKNVELSIIKRSEDGFIWNNGQGN